MLRKIVIVTLSLVLFTSLAYGSGFSIYEHGARATALGGAFIAQANDASALFYNPAGITSLKGTNFALGTTIIVPTFGFTGPSPSTDKTDAEKAVFNPVHFYATHELSDQLAVGFAFYTLFGLGSEWPAGWIGRELNVNTQLKTFFFNPVIAFKPIENLSVSAGVSFVYGDVVMEQDYYVPPPLPPILPDPLYVPAKLEGSTTAWGFNVGLQFDVTEQLSFGAVYRHNVKLEFDDGEATFDVPITGVPPVDAQFAALIPSSTTGKAAIEMPNLIGLGISYDFTEQLTAEFDWMQLGWSSYDVLTLEFADPVAGETTVSDDKKFEDSYSLRFGLEYRIDDSWALRGGYLRDNAAVPDTHIEPTLPENGRNLYSVGVGWNSNSLTVDAFFMLLTQDDREITTSTKTITIVETEVDFNGKYEGSALLFGVTLGYALD